MAEPTAARPALPILVGGAGEKVTCGSSRSYADMWNTFGPLESWSAKNAVLDDWCARVERHPADMERTIFIQGGEAERLDDYIAADAQPVILGAAAPDDRGPLRALLTAADS